MSRREHTVIQLIAVSCILLAAIRQPVIDLLKESNLSVILIPAGVFILIYKLFVFMYRNWLWQYIHRNDYLGGTWLYLLENRTRETNRNLYGIFNLRHSADELIIESGSVWYYGFEPMLGEGKRGDWHSHLMATKDSELLIIFEMNDRSQIEQATSGPKYKGMLELTISGRPPNRLEGIFRDFDERSGNYGTIVAMKIKEPPSQDHLVESFRHKFNVNVLQTL